MSISPLGNKFEKAQIDLIKTSSSRHTCYPKCKDEKNANFITDLQHKPSCMEITPTVPSWPPTATIHDLSLQDLFIFYYLS